MRHDIRTGRIAPRCAAAIPVRGLAEPQRCRNATTHPSGRCWRHRG